MKKNKHTKPLDDLLVVSVEQALSAPFCTARLAEAGARVIKIERTEGDFARGYDTAAKGNSSYFTWTNQGKESLTLNFRDLDDARLLEKIISQADVFVQNLAPSAMKRAGFGSARLRARYPELITLDISGYGDNDNVKNLKAYDFLIQAESGLTSISGGVNEMGRIGVSICDIGAGMTAHAAIIEALLLREKTGQGAALAVSLFDVAADWMTVPMIHRVYGKGAPRRVGLRHPSMAPYGAFATSEGKLTLVAIQNDREWLRFCYDVLENKEAALNEHFKSNNLRVEHLEELEALILSFSTKMTQDQFREKLAYANIAYGSVNTVTELFTHPALRKREVFNENAENVVIPAAPIRWLDHAVDETQTQAPKIGSHNSFLRQQFAS